MVAKNTSAAVAAPQNQTNEEQQRSFGLVMSHCLTVPAFVARGTVLVGHLRWWGTCASGALVLVGHLC